MSIGEVGRRAGLEPSAIRYYERLGLLPKPPRAGGKRRYAATVLEWLALIALARAGGFTMAETKVLMMGFAPRSRPDALWKRLAAAKLAEIDEMVARAERMREVLRIGLDCGCFRLEDCGALLDIGLGGVREDCLLPAEALQRPKRIARFAGTSTSRASRHG
ncbi:MAG: MerR family transcriptional regulator [Gemmatimonadaceae bacterium]|nr:MerR family transcriptional regulator [Gemmatimonadaceae bacterium]